MGMWCETCGITQLPINGNDKCRVFFIVKQDHKEEGSGSCYINDVWFPRGLPLVGNYDSYGRLENLVENINSNIMLNGLKKDWVSYKAKNEFELDVEPNNLTILSLIDLIRENCAEIYNGRSPSELKILFENKNYQDLNNLLSNLPEDRPKCTLGMMFVLEDVYQAILKYDPFEAHYRDGGYLYRRRSEIISFDMEEWYTKRLNFSKKFPGENLCNVVCHWNIFSRHTHDPPFCKGISYYFDFLNQKIIEGVPYENSEVREVANGIIDYTKFSRFMSESRKFWTPQTGKGGQHNETAPYKLLAKTILSICKKEDAEYPVSYISRQDRIEHNKKEFIKRKNKV